MQGIKKNNFSSEVPLICVCDNQEENGSKIQDSSTPPTVDALADAPRANEILVVIAVTDSGRPFPRVGGLTVDEIVGEDGLR